MVKRHELIKGSVGGVRMGSDALYMEENIDCASCVSALDALCSLIQTAASVLDNRECAVFRYR